MDGEKEGKGEEGLLNGHTKSESLHSKFDDVRDDVRFVISLEIIL